LNFTYIRAFYTVAKFKSFTLAAQQLNVSQPTLSQQVKSMERQYGFPLIKRNKKIVRLTQEGEVIFSYVEKIMQVAREMDREVEDLHSGHLKIGTTPTLSRYLLPNIIVKLKEKNPDLKVKIYTGLSKEILEMVLDLECHVGIAGRIPYPDPVIFRNILKPKLSFISRDIKKDRIHIKELAGYPILFPEEGSATRDYIIEEFRKRGIPLNIYMDCENPSALKHMVHLGMGGAFFPRYGVEEEVKEGKYRCIELLDDLHLTIDLIYLNDWKRSKVVRMFVEVLFEEARPWAARGRDSGSRGVSSGLTA
jgi:DNA-binding transcriptional LysR family regulator